MNTDTASSRPATATMPPNGPNHPAGPLSEAEFLQLQAEQARQAMTQTLEAMKESLKTAGDVNLWAQHHPWLTVGAAAAAGFTAGSAITSTVQGKPSVEGNGQPMAYAASAAPPPPRGHSALWNSMLNPLFDLAKVAIQSSIAAAMGGAMQKQAQEEAGAQSAEYPQSEYAGATAAGGEPYGSF